MNCYEVELEFLDWEEYGGTIWRTIDFTYEGGYDNSDIKSVMNFFDRLSLCDLDKYIEQEKCNGEWGRVLLSLNEYDGEDEYVRTLDYKEIYRRTGE